MERTRRGFLAALGTAAAGSVAGCAAPRTDTADAESFVALADRVIPSVVRVRVYGPSGPTAQGSGWLFGDDVVVTNEHVVAGAETVRIQFADGTWVEAELLGTDVYSDLAALRVPTVPNDAPPLPLVEEQAPVGTKVAAFGSPYGLGGSMSTGVVSGQNRSLPTVRNFTVADAVQTDAALNPGNSGGPLVTLDGSVAGVVTQAGGENLGFAISAALTERVVPSLVESGSYSHPYMGVAILGVAPLLAQANDLSAVRGVYVDRVRERGPADGVLQGSTGEARVQGAIYPTGGDVIRALGDTPVDTLADLGTYLALETRPGDTIAVTVLRDGAETTVDLTLGERPEPDV